MCQPKPEPSEKDAVLNTLTVISTHDGSNSGLTVSAELVKSQLTKPQPDQDKEDEVVESLAKNLPKVSKGILAAIKAFRKGDDLTGAAEIMNTCGALATLIGSFTAAGGPPGMLVGAIFSMIGQIVAFFQPAKESDVDKIKAFLLSIEAQGIKNHADANLVSIRNAAKGMRKQAKETAKALKKFNDFQVLPLFKAVVAASHAISGGTEDLTPWKPVMDARFFNHTDYLAFWEALDKEKLHIAGFKLIDGPTVLQHWGVASWLKNPDNYDRDEWPEILGMFCHAWADLLTAYITIISFANGADMELAFSYVAPSNENKWPYAGAEDDRKNIEMALMQLRSNASKLLDDIRNCNETMSDILAILTPAARKRGMFVVRYPWDITTATGRRAFRESSWQNSLWASCSRFLITPPNDGLTSATAQYHFWCVDTRGPKIGHERINSDTRTPVGGTNSYLGSADKVADICVLPHPDDPNANYVYCAHEEGAPAPNVGYLELFATDGKENFKKVSFAPGVKAKLFRIRAVTPPPVTLPDDPDGDAMPDILKGGKNHYNSIIYGALRSSPDIYVDRDNKRCYVPSPWGYYAGIAADPYYLWVFGTSRFACATHASVMQCIKNQERDPNSKPRWIMGPPIDHLLYEGEQYPGNRQEREGEIPPHPGLVDFCPCDDGTLFISLTTRQILRTIRPDSAGRPYYYYKAKDSNSVYTAVYRVDLKKQTLTVESYDEDSKDPWVKLPGGDNDARQVQKLPIYCWGLLEGLKDACRPESWKSD